MNRVFPFVVFGVFSVCLSLGLLVQPGQAQTFAPEELEGDWGTPNQCEAQAAVGFDETVERITDAPYRFEGHWLSRWFFYCRIMEAFPLHTGFRVRVLCGEDAIERPWEIDVEQGDDGMTMTWYALGEDLFASRPWFVGPLQMCAIPDS